MTHANIVDAMPYQRNDRANPVRHSLSLLGPVRLQCAGVDCTPKGRRARAILAMLAVAPHGMRGRRWLQSRLWSERGDKEGSASLRQCLSELRRSLGAHRALISFDKQSLTLDINNIDIDTRRLEQHGTEDFDLTTNLPDFLEDLDIADPEFDDWLRDQRRYWEERLREAALRRHSGRVDSPSALSNATSSNATLPGFAVRDGAGAVGRIGGFIGTPVVAVLPPNDTASDPSLCYLIEGVTQELIDQLSRIRWLATISRSSCYAALTLTSGAAEFGAKLGAHYVVQLRIPKADASMRINIELTQTDGNLLVWGRSFEIVGSLTETMLTGIAEEIAGNLGGNISRTEQHRARRLPDEVSRMNDLVWRGRWHMNRLSRHDAERAEFYFHQALQIEPGNVEARVHFAWCTLWRAWAMRSEAPAIRAASSLGRQIIELDPTDARGYWVTGTAEAWLRQSEESDCLIRRAIHLCPSLSLAHAQLGSNAILRGEPERSLPSLALAIKLSPHDQQMFFFLGEQAMAHWLLGNFEDALDLATQSTMRRPSYWYALMIKYLSLKSLNRRALADEAREDLRRARPQLRADDINWLPYIDPALNAYFVAQLGLDQDTTMHA
jgi:TolB-like protein